LRIDGAHLCLKLKDLLPLAGLGAAKTLVRVQAGW